MTQAETGQAPPAPELAHLPEAPQPVAYGSDFERLKAQPVVNMRSIFNGEDVGFETYDGRKIMLNINMLNAVLPEAFKHAHKDEVCAFVHYCATNRLDPFRKQVYFIKYDEKAAAAFVAAWTVFIDRANRNPNFDGYECGIVWHVQVGDNVQVVRGQPCDYAPDDTHIIAGGWARAHRKDQSHARYVEVPIGEMQAKRYDMKAQKKVPTRMWSEAQTTMATKTPSARAIRLLFPDELGGLIAEGESKEIPYEVTAGAANTGFADAFNGNPKPRPKTHVDQSTGEETPAAEPAPNPEAAKQGQRKRFGP